MIVGQSKVNPTRRQTKNAPPPRGRELTVDFENFRIEPQRITPRKTLSVLDPCCGQNVRIVGVLTGNMGLLLGMPGGGGRK